MHKHIRLLQIGFDITMGVLQVRIDVLVLHIFQINPFVLFNSKVADGILKIIVLKGPLVNDREDTVNALALFNFLVI